MTHVCKDCNYSTDNNTDLAKHNKTKAHLKKVQAKQAETQVVQTPVVPAQQTSAGRGRPQSRSNAASAPAQSATTVRKTPEELYKLELELKQREELYRRREYLLKLREEEFEKREDLFIELQKDKEYFKALATQSYDMASDAMRAAKNAVEAVNKIMGHIYRSQIEEMFASEDFARMAAEHADSDKSEQETDSDDD